MGLKQSLYVARAGFPICTLLMCENEFNSNSEIVFRAAVVFVVVVDPISAQSSIQSLGFQTRAAADPLGAFSDSLFLAARSQGIYSASSTGYNKLGQWTFC